MKQLVWFGMFVGTTVGGMVPSLWGAGVFSFWSVILSAVGGILGIYAGYRLGRG
jgi:uncharacterized membrane protein